MDGRGRRSGRTSATSTERPASGPTSSPTRLCSIDEAAEHLGISVRFIRRLVAERRIRHVKGGHYVRFDRGDLDAFVAAEVREAVQG
jgi:excisionase family DNA binding protein